HRAAQHAASLRRLAGAVRAGLDARSYAALRVQPSLACLGRRARHPHGLHQARRFAPYAAGVHPAATRPLLGLDRADTVSMSTPPQLRRFDAIVVGAGGSGMRAALELARAGLKTAV